MKFLWWVIGLTRRLYGRAIVRMYGFDRGGPHVTDRESVINALLLTDVCMRGLSQDIAAVESFVDSWGDDERAAAFRWAALEHLAASDNDVDRVPCPPHVQAIRW
jgi:hypothetical protein